MILLGRIGESDAIYPAHSVIIDITVKNNPDHILAPLWSMVKNYKDGKINWRQYITQYQYLLEQRFEQREEEFHKLANLALDRTVVFKCFCPDERYCHRTLAKQAIERLQATKSIKTKHVGIPRKKYSDKQIVVKLKEN